MANSNKGIRENNSIPTPSFLVNPELVSILQAHHDLQLKLEAYMFAEKGKCTYPHEDEAFMLDNAATEIQDTLITCAGKEVWDNVTKGK